MSEREDIIAKICTVIGNVTPDQFIWEQDPASGSVVVKVLLRGSQLDIALRENGRFFREAAMQTGFDIQIGMADE